MAPALLNPRGTLDKEPFMFRALAVALTLSTSLALAAPPQVKSVNPDSLPWSERASFFVGARGGIAAPGAGGEKGGNPGEQCQHFAGDASPGSEQGGDEQYAADEEIESGEAAHAGLLHLGDAAAAGAASTDFFQTCLSLERGLVAGKRAAADANTGAGGRVDFFREGRVAQFFDLALQEFHIPGVLIGS